MKSDTIVPYRLDNFLVIGLSDSLLDLFGTLTFEVGLTNKRLILKSVEKIKN